MKSSRRTLLKAGLALPALTLESVVGGPAVQRNSSFDPWVEIHAAHLRHNVREIQQRIHSRPILAVIKNNGYGLGIVTAARLLEPLEGIAGFAVVKLQEAIALRDAGIRKPVLLMGPFEEKELEEVAARNIMPMVYTPMGSVLDRVSGKLRKPIPIHVCVDTGIGRVGVPYRDAPSLIRELALRRTSVRIEGVMMTFTEDPDFDLVQLDRFRSLCRQMEREGIALGKKHAASSYALFQHPEAFLDMVRPGMAIYGIYPEAEFRAMKVMELRPALSLKARVIYVKQLQKGESAGYNRVYKARENVWVATLPVGHADGLPRTVVKGAHVRIGTDLYPIVAISASHTIVEIGPEPRVKIGDVAVLFDWQEGSRPEDVAASSGSSVYDLTMHLSPLLPRRIL
ncbi:MAG TPA: alanine racemase [Blastocatellia bacterium]|nr:alanine racemase [Blastocatellia bacterium]